MFPISSFIRSCTCCLHVVLDRSLEGRWVRTDDLTDLLAILEEHERRHGADGEFLCDLGDLVNVELVEACVGVCVGEPRRNALVYVLMHLYGVSWILT